MARKKLTFESAMESLEEIVNQLESGDIPLNELIEKYNEGMKMSAFCLSELDKAEQVLNVQVSFDGEKVVEQNLDIEGDSQ